MLLNKHTTASHLLQLWLICDGLFTHAEGWKNPFISILCWLGMGILIWGQRNYRPFLAFLVVQVLAENSSTSLLRTHHTKLCLIVTSKSNVFACSACERNSSYYQTLQGSELLHPIPNKSNVKSWVAPAWSLQWKWNGNKMFSKHYKGKDHVKLNYLHLPWPVLPPSEFPSHIVNAGW